MPASDDALRRIDAVVRIGLRLASQAPSGRIALSKVAHLVQPEWVPAPWNRTVWPQFVDGITRSAPGPLPAATVAAILEDAWGTAPDTELETFDPMPVAVTAVAQVHRATRDGDPVAVKVLRPGITTAVRQDLGLLDALAGPLHDAFPGIDAAALIRQARERVLDELDLEHQAGLQRRLYRAVRRDPTFVIPAPKTDLCHESVLVSEWLDGTPLSRATDIRDPDRIASELLRYVVGGLEEGLVDADLDPDDVLLRDDGRIGVVGFGGLTVVEPKRAGLAKDVIDAFAAGDGARLGTALAELGVIDTRFGDLALSVAAEVLGPLGGETPSRLDLAAIEAAAERADGREHEIVELVLNGGLDAVDLWPSRAIAQLYAVMIPLGATVPWRERLAAALASGWGS